MARAFLQTRSMTRAADDVVLLWCSGPKETRAAASSPALYVFGLQHAEGFVIVAGDDAVSPILGYSERGTFRAHDIPAHVQYWLDEYERQIVWAQENDVAPSQETVDRWNNIGASSTDGAGAVYLPTALWNQKAPYNNQCPEIDGVRSVTGCVATALAILMKYHRWPEVGEGQAAYLTKTYKKYVSAVFNKTYDWDNMPDEYIAGSYTEEQAAAVAMLMQHCGVISLMDYNPTFSSAYPRTALLGLAEHMRYDVSAYELYRNWYSQAEWNAMIRHEIDENRPVVYGGRTSSAGHQFVVHGYNADGYFNINWGWGGSYNGLFLLSALTPSGQGTGGTAGGYNYSQNAMFSLKKPEEGSTPTSVLAFLKGTAGDVTYSGLTPTTSYIKREVPFQIRMGFARNYGIKPFTGHFVLAMVDKNGNVKEFISDEMKVTDLGLLVGAGRVLNALIQQNVETGDRIRLLYKGVNDTAWKWMRGDPGTTTEVRLDNYITGINEQPLVPQQDVLIEHATAHEIIITAPAAISRITICTVGGSVVKQLEPEEGQCKKTVAINDLPRGIYIVGVATKRGVAQVKFVK